MQYDYVIIGAGLFGSVFAREMTDIGKKCLVIDKRKHIAGNIYTEQIDGINVHMYGPHIFHCSDDSIWQYVNKFSKFNHFIYEPIANYNNQLYNLPFNMNTFNKLWNVLTPTEAFKKIEEQKIKCDNPTTLEKFALANVGREIYDKLIYGYTLKQWQKHPSELPASIIKRIPLRFNFSNNYYIDKYQGIPIGGYTNMVKNMLSGIEVKLETDYFKNKEYFHSIADKIVFTGKIDEFFNYEFGMLEYRNLRFEIKKLENIENFQGVAGMNFTDTSVDYTRIIEHKHFEFGKSNNTVLTYEYPDKFDMSKEAYYPINDQNNDNIYKKYRDKSKLTDRVIFGGRLAEYKYYDMHQVIGSALAKSKKIQLNGS